MTTGLLGSPKPRIEHVPAYVTSHGEDACAVAALAGLEPDDAQRYALSAILGETTEGKWSAPQSGLLAPRQNLKTTVLMVVALYCASILGQRVLWTAHETKTSYAALLELKQLIEGCPSLAKRLQTVRTANGSEAIIFNNGGWIRFVARSKNSGRGLTADVLILDEAQELSSLAMAALMPTLSARPNPLVIFAGTVPDDQRNDSSVWTAVRDAGRLGENPRLCWLEWSAADSFDIDANDRAFWAIANSALGVRIGEDFVAGELTTLTFEDFCRERLAIWPSGSASGIFGNGWGASLQPDSTITGTPVFGLAVSLDRAYASVGTVGRNDEGQVHLELVERQRGTGWLVACITDLHAKHGGSVVIDGRGPGSVFIEPIRATGVPVIVASTADLTEASANLYDAITGDEPTVAHLGQSELDAAVQGAKKRPVGDRWLPGRKSSDSDVDPLEAVLLAFLGLDETADYDILQSAW